MFEELFLRKKVNFEKLWGYGFKDMGDVYKYTADIMDGSFVLNVTVDKGGAVDTALTEKDSGEEYVLYKTEACGSFVGEVRAAVETVLSDIAGKCCEASVFKAPQTNRLIEYVREKYGDELQYLWKKFPDNAVYRRKDNQKWYAAILTVAKSKLGLEGAGNIEILDLRTEPALLEQTVDNKKFFPGYHMNKKSWYTICLDGSVEDEEIFERIDVSYELAKKKQQGRKMR